MGKRRSKSENYISKGEHSNVARRWIKTCRMGRAEGERIDAQWKAFKQGKRVILTVKNPNKNQIEIENLCLSKIRANKVLSC